MSDAREVSDMTDEALMEPLLTNYNSGGDWIWSDNMPAPWDLAYEISSRLAESRARESRLIVAGNALMERCGLPERNAWREAVKEA